VLRVLVLGVLIACGDNLAGDHITITADPAQAGAEIPPSFLGASYETSVLVTDPSYFTAENATLVRLFDLLGLRSLRLGGNEADLGPLPSEPQLLAMLGFVDAAALEVLYTLRLRTFDPPAAAVTARYLLDHSTRVACLSVGNEADWYLETFDDYVTRFRAYVAAIDDPRARYCAPDSGDTEWVSRFAAELGPDDNVVLANLHEYFGGNGQGIDAAGGRAWMLSDEIVHWYGVAHQAIAPAGRSLPYRLAETNSYANGGCPGASDTFTSALWGLDYLHFWAGRGAAGVSFHTGDHVSGATTTYSLFKTSPDGYRVHPLGYAVKAFELGGRGRILPLAVEPIGTRITAYGVLAADGSIAITIVNKTHDSDARTAQIAIRTFAHTAEAWRLEAADVTATDGVTLGGAPITDDATWAGTPELLDVRGGAVSLEVPAASAVVVRLAP
jgi:hypothetical protein